MSELTIFIASIGRKHVLTKLNLITVKSWLMMDLLKLLESNLSIEKKLQNIISQNKVAELEDYLKKGGDPNHKTDETGRQLCPP